MNNNNDNNNMNKTNETDNKNNKNWKDVLVLYGSQRGCVEKFAKQFQQIIMKRYCTIVESSTTTTCIEQQEQEQNQKTWLNNIRIMELDDFLENDTISWTPIVHIFVSSYGAGAAPMGAIQFRKLCNILLQQQQQQHQQQHQQQTNKNKMLNGLYFTMCGFGDSFYTRTYMKNPTTIMDALIVSGATMIGPVGTIDMNIDIGSSDLDHKQQCFQEWLHSLWEPLEQHILALQKINNDNNNCGDPVVHNNDNEDDDIRNTTATTEQQQQQPVLWVSEEGLYQMKMETVQLQR